MEQHGKSPTRNKRRNRFNKKKKQEVKNEQNNAKPEVQNKIESVVKQPNQLTTTKNPKQMQTQQRNDKLPVNLGQKTKQDCSQYKDKQKKDKEDGELVSLEKRNLNLENKPLKSQEIQELKKRVSQQMVEMEKLLIKQLQEFNKTHQCFNVRAFFSGQDQMSHEERAREIKKAVQAVTEGATKHGDRERRMQNTCFQYDELRQRLEALENISQKNETSHHAAVNVTAKDIIAKTSTTKGEIKEGFASNNKEDDTQMAYMDDGQDENQQNSNSCKPKKLIAQACIPNSTQTEEQHVTPNHLKTTQNLTGKTINSSDKCFGGSHPGVMNIEKEIAGVNVDVDVPLSSSPIDEDQRSESLHQQLSSDDSNESLAFQAFAAPMKFLRRVKKKVGNFLFSAKKEKGKDSDDEGRSNSSYDDIDVEARAGTSHVVPGPCLSQPVQRAFLENDTAHGKTGSRRGLEEILVTPESPIILSTKTSTVKGHEANLKQTERGRPATGLVSQGKEPKEVKNEIVGKNAAAKDAPRKEALLSQEKFQPNRTESAKDKFTAVVNQTGIGGSPQRESAKKNTMMQSVTATQKKVPTVSQNGVPVDKQKSAVGKRATPSNGAGSSTTTPQRNMKQTFTGNVPAAIGSNPTPKSLSTVGSIDCKNVQAKHQNVIASSTRPKIVPGKTSISTKHVGISASKAPTSVSSGGRVPSKNQANLPQQPVPQKEQRKDAIKSPTQGVVTKSTLSEEKKIYSPGKLQERADNIAQVVATNKTLSPAPSTRQQVTPKDKSSVIHKQDSRAGESKSPTTKIEKPSLSKVPQIAASLPASTKASPTTGNQTTRNAPVQQVKSTNSERELKQVNTQTSSPYERRILKARRRIVFEANKNPESSEATEISNTGEADYETVMPENFEQAVAEAMDNERFSVQTSFTEKPANRCITGNCRSAIPLQDIPESSPLEINVEVQDTPSPLGRKKKYRGKYATGFSNLRKSINCCCEFVCDYCVPSWEWDKVVANQRKKR